MASIKRDVNCSFKECYHTHLERPYGISLPTRMPVRGSKCGRLWPLYALLSPLKTRQVMDLKRWPFKATIQCCVLWTNLVSPIRCLGRQYVV